MAAIAIGRLAVPPRLVATGVLARRSIGEPAAIVQVLVGGAFVLAAAERPSVLTSAHHGAFTEWFAGPLRGMLPGLARSQSMLGRGLHVRLPVAQRGDPVYAYSNWHHLRSPYGPLFTLMLLPVADWTYKAIATAASLGLLAAVWACARRLGRPRAAAVAFVGLNPIVLVYSLGGKRNDVLMMACVMAGGLLILAGREMRGAAALAAMTVLAGGAVCAAVVVRAGTVPALLHHYGVDVGHTGVWQSNQRFERSLPG